MQVTEFFDAVENGKQSFLWRNGLADSESAKRKKKRKADTAEGESASEEEERRQTDSQLASQSRFETSQAGIQIP